MEAVGLGLGWVRRRVVVGFTGKAGGLATGPSEAGAGIATGVVEPGAEELEPELDEADIVRLQRGG